MKRIYIIIWGLIFPFLVSCNKDFLEVSPRSELSDESFFRNQEDAEQALTALYNTFLIEDKLLIWNVLAYNTWSDDMVNVWRGSDYNTHAAGTYAADSWFIYDMWDRCYTYIRRTNVFLTNINKVDMPDATRKRFIAEAKFIRAYYYHNLVMLFGGVPIIDKPLSLNELKIPRDNRNEVIDFIITDLNSYPYLADNPTQKGRVSKGAALALKSRILLYEYRFEEAADAAQQVMELGLYDLFRANGTQSYLTLHNLGNENNNEVIFDIQFIENILGGPHQLWLNLPSLAGWGASNPLQSIVDAFEDNQGKSIDESTIYDANNPYLNRDPRLDMAVIRHGSSVTDYLGNTKTVSTLTAGADNAGLSGFYVRKNADPASFVPTLISGLNHILIRYAEVLLNYAEAKNEFSGPDNTVYDAVNSIRNRVGMPDLPANLNKQQMRERIRQERRVELCFEGLRTWDIKRWGIAPAVMNGPIYGALNPFTNQNILIESRNFDPAKNYLFPIPQRERDLIGGDILLQNPGYGNPVFRDDTWPKPEVFQ